MPFTFDNFFKKSYLKNIFTDICSNEKMGQLTNPFKIPHQEKS